jgi:hypothetical protein
MSNTREKLEEAKYFLEQMQVCVEDSKKFAFNLSAFLSAARSVTFIMQSEFKSSPEFSHWYKDKQKEMNNDEDFRFFNNLRVATIHQKTVVPHKKTEIDISASITISYIIKVIDKEGNVISERTSEPKKTDSPKETEVTVKHSWYFEERPNEELLGLCDKYIQKIEKWLRNAKNNFIKIKMWLTSLNGAYLVRATPSPKFLPSVRTSDILKPLYEIRQHNKDFEVKIE